MPVDEIVTRIEWVVNLPLFKINETPVTIISLILFVFMLSFFVIASWGFRHFFLRQLLGRFQLDEGLQFTFLRITHYLVILVGVIVSFQFVGINLTGLMVIFGLLSVGIGFGLQNLTSNFVAGLMLLFERPIKIGDRITVGDTEGDVIAINIRSTTVRTENNITIIVPNSEFVSSNVINWSHADPKIRLEIDVGVSYQSDLDNVLQALKEVAAECPDILKTPEPRVHLIEFGDSSWNMRLLAWMDRPQQHRQVRSDLKCAIVRKFRAKGIEIPFPQRDLHLRSPLPVPLATLDDRKAA